MVNGDGRNIDSSTEQSLQTSKLSLPSTLLSDDSKSFGSTDESEDWDFIRSSSSDFNDAHFNPQPASKKDVLKNNKAVQELTINKLNYKKIRLVGREQEIKTLKSCIDEASSPTDQHRSKRFVLIQGYSGVGKSSLVAAARAHVQSTISNSTLPQMAHGKFDQQNYDEPYSGIAAVFDEIFDNIQSGVEKDDADCIAIQTEIRAELGSEIKLLQNLIPSISELVDDDAASVASGSVSGSANRNFEADFERLKYSFRVLTRILSAHCSPLIFVLDDLQWSDMASLRTIDFLISDTGNSTGLVIIGLYRSNEVDDTHPLTKTIQDLQSKSNKLLFDITNIELQSLDTDSINKIILAMLNMDEGDRAKTKGLAEICCRRTLGNPFFVIEFITMLEMEGLLSFNLGLLKWVWSEKEIEEATMSTSNVVDLLQARMKKMPEDLQHLMQYAACLGSEFSVSALEIIWVHSGHKESACSDGLGVPSLLRRLEEGNFIERSSTNTCRWLHDKIQEAALSFGLALEKSFEFNIGLILYQNLKSRELDKTLFEVANLINTAGQQTSNVEFATLNLRAAKKARDASAFHSAAAFANTGIRLLPNDKWQTHGDLTLNLYLLGTEMESAVGNGSKVEEYSSEVLSQNHVTLLQKLPTFLAHAHKLSNVDREYGETIEYLRPVMREFGYWVPRSVMLPFHSLRVLRRTVQAAKKIPSSFYEKPRLMTDAKKKAEILLLDRITNASYFSHNHLMMMFSTCRMVEITLEHGVSPMSGPVFASLAIIVNGILKDRKTALNLAEIALSFYRVVRSRFLESQTLFLTNAHIFGWTTPMSTILTSMRRAYKLACRSGNTEFAMWALHSNDSYPFYMGRKLGPIAESTAKSVPQMEELGQKAQTWMTRIRWQLVLNLMGDADDVLVLEGIAFSSEEYEKEIGSDDHMEPAVKGAEIELLLFYGEYKQAAKLSLERGDADTFFGGIPSMYDYFHRCMALYARARQIKKCNKYSRLANQIRKMIHQWAEDGNPNVKHFDCVLQAEHAALDGKYDVSEKQYKEAIKLAARTGHMHHAALFNERYADMLKNRIGFEEEAAYHLKESIRWYDEWGAAWKVKMLKETVAT